MDEVTKDSVIEELEKIFDSIPTEVSPIWDEYLKNVDLDYLAWLYGDDEIKS